MWLQIGIKGVVAADKACPESPAVGKARSSGVLGTLTENSNPNFGNLGDGKLRTIGHGGVQPRNTTIRITALTSSDGLDEGIIKRFLRRKLGVFKSCFSRSVKDRSKETASKTQIKFTIEVAGETKTVKANGPKELGACLEAAVKTIRFPKLEGKEPVKVSYGLAFKWDPNPPRPKSR